MKRTIGQAAIFAAVVTVAVIAIQLAAGYYQTVHYVPDIVQSYQDADHLQHRTSFGIAGNGFGVVRFAALFAAAMIGYILVKTLVDW